MLICAVLRYCQYQTGKVSLRLVLARSSTSPGRLSYSLSDAIVSVVFYIGKVGVIDGLSWPSPDRQSYSLSFTWFFGRIHGWPVLELWPCSVCVRSVCTSASPFSQNLQTELKLLYTGFRNESSSSPSDVLVIGHHRFLPKSWNQLETHCWLPPTNCPTFFENLWCILKYVHVP